MISKQTLFFVILLFFSSASFAQDHPRTLKGTEHNPNSSWTAVTDKDVYSVGDRIVLTITNNTYENASLVKNVWIERVENDEGVEHFVIKKVRGMNVIPPLKSAVFKWNVPKDFRAGNYRLVVFTSTDFSIPPVISNEFEVRKG